MGNQLFQYALAKAVASRVGASLSIDASRLNRDNSTIRQYGLAGLNTPAPGAAMAVDHVVKMWPRGPGPHCIIFNVADHSYDKIDPRGLAPEMERLFSQGARAVELDGFVFDEGHFSHVEDSLRDDLVEVSPVKFNPSFGVPVAVHVRRGDFLTNEHSAAGFMVNLGKDYYDSAACYIEEWVEQPNFFVFSDDIAFCKANMSSKFNFVEGGTASSDMSLMRQCKHHIIANSTFSWWGAWLAQTPGQIVVSPDRWFKPVSNYLETDITPERWVRLSAQVEEARA
jgi:hypothetical protein